MISSRDRTVAVAPDRLGHTTATISTTAFNSENVSFTSVPAPQDQRLPNRPLIPFSESENPDAIALRSAISILQIQRKQTLSDLKELERIKNEAAANPEAFVRGLEDGTIKPVSRDLFHPSPEELIAKPPSPTGSLPEASSVRMNGVATDDESANEPSQSTPVPLTLNTLPGPQNIVRCPPVNWAKYHIVGDALNRIHKQQKLWPSLGEPGGSEAASLAGMTDRPPKTAIAAPYDPWTNKLTKSPASTRSGTMKYS
ncbi:hypothetical protein MMC25_000384 [Agyrium rufum]|nr:hypothetical protein [Agyrium rufum]